MKLLILLLVLTNLSFAQKSLPDTIITSKNDTITCLIQEVNPAYVVYAKSRMEKILSIDKIQNVYIPGLKMVFSADSGFKYDQRIINNFILKREYSLRNIGLIVGGGFRVVDSKIQNHTANSDGTVNLILGIEKSLYSLPLSIEFLFEAGLGGEIVNSDKETYGYVDFGLGLKLYAFPIQSKINLILEGGISKLSASITDNTDSADDDFFIDSNFHEGQLEVNSQSFGYFFKIGLLYNINRNIGILGSFQLSSHKMDFRDFKSNALGPGASMRLVFYP